MKIYTKSGDHGDTGLLGGDRIRKDSERIQAIGDKIAYLTLVPSWHVRLWESLKFYRSRITRLLN
jgi:hypothetical protein